MLPWNLLSSVYGDAVLGFVGRYFLVDAIIDSKVERWFAAKQNTLLLLARQATLPPDPYGDGPNPAIPADHCVRFVRFKRPLDELLDMTLERGKRAEDLVEHLLAVTKDDGSDLRWDIRVVPQIELVERTAAGSDTVEGRSDEEDATA